MDEVAIFSAGCFRGVEADFRRVPGVRDVEVGYTGGTTVDPTYRQVCTGTTGHAEAVRVTFDPAQVSFERLLEVFWTIHDPGRTAAQANFKRPIVTEIVASAPFYRAEEYHQQYFQKQGLGAH
jgi:peptide-methionine (S)-S-oxide reductase